MSNFKDLYERDVSRFVEKKGRFDYLSWAYAWKEFKIAYADASFIVHEYSEHNLPFLKTDIGYFVKVSVTADKHTHTELMPVTDNYNKTIAKPNAFDINTSIKRCLTKAIALHGLGLGLWVNEDLPQNTTEQVKPKTGLNQTPQATQKKPEYNAELPVNDVETNAIKTIMKEIHDMCRNMTSDEKRDALKKASSYANPNTYKTTFIDDINRLTINGHIPSVARLNVTYKNLLHEINDDPIKMDFDELAGK